MEQLTISLTNWLSIDDKCAVFEFGVDFTFFDTEFSWLFIFRFDATLASAHCKRKTPVTSRYTRKMSECTGRLPEFQECTGGLPVFFILLKLQFRLSR